MNINRQDINLKVIRLEYNISPPISVSDVQKKCQRVRDIVQKIQVKTKKTIPPILIEKIKPIPIEILVERLLSQIYGCGIVHCERKTSESERCTSVSPIPEVGYFKKMRHIDMMLLKKRKICDMITILKDYQHQFNALLVKRLQQKDALIRRTQRLCNIITNILRKISGDGEMKFSVSPKGGPNVWAEWLKAMKLVARLPAGIPPAFRKKLWLILAEQHLKVKGIDWVRAERICFSEWTNPDDSELGVQIVKDLHRTGCSLFCGSEGKENQAVLKRVLLAYARWNKAVGYCQGFNMLAALILEVMDRSESDSLKVMIYLIEAVLPEGYFANNLRGLSVDMAVFRDLLKLRLPRLSAHLEKLQKSAAEGSCYEPPLTNVFTMQWFLTLFCNCLPRNTVLRVWDLVFLEGDEVLLTTALAIWDTLQDRILIVESADEFYSVMGELARETLEAPPATSEALLMRAVQLGPVPELPKLRDKHRYNITPWAHSVQSAAKKGLRLFYSEDETDSSDDGDKLALTTAYGLQANGRGRSALVAAGVFGHPDREKLALDISALKQQYARLRERQRQAHIILAAACARQPSVSVSTGSGPISVNHLLLGKSAIVSARGRRLGPPQGAIPPSRTTKTSKSVSKTQPLTQNKNETLHWKDENHKKSANRRDSIKWKDIKQPSVKSDEADEELDEDGKVITESEVNEILQTSMRTRRKSESSSYSECSESSTSTSLCDEPNRMSDFDSEPASFSDNYITNLDDNLKDDFNKEIANTDILGTSETLQNKSTICSEEKQEEFGNYVQEFEELLDRTNNIENESNEYILEKNANEDCLQTIPAEEDKKEEVYTNNIKINTFNEFVGSNRGESLRNYLDEFRKADVAVKYEKWQTSKNQIFDETDETSKHNEELFKDDIDASSQTKHNTEEKLWENVEETNTKPFVYPDIQSHSCERSVSSSISSISPILKNTIMALDSPTFLCYKSPTRLDSDIGSEYGEEEKPIVLKIDKYFEHSPEFFGARKFGTYVSSDEEDDAFHPKCKKTTPEKAESLSLDSVEPISLTNKDIKLYDNILKESEENIPHFESPIIRNLIISPISPNTNNPQNLCDTKPEYLPSLSPLKANFHEDKTNIVDKDLNIVSFSLKSPDSKSKGDKTPSETNDEIISVLERASVLEKTKSEELPYSQRHSFSVLDDEIEAIRLQSGRRNSERALRIIQENSKILHRILVNQVNKTNLRDCFQEESSENLNEDMKEIEKKKYRLYEYKTQKPLISPRSSSLDESLQRKNRDIFSGQTFELSLRTPIHSKETTPQSTEKKITDNNTTSLQSPKIKENDLISPKFDKFHTPYYETKVNVTESSTLTTNLPENDENKTDMFGWENKGFSANQRISSLYSNDFNKSNKYTNEIISHYINKTDVDTSFSYNLKEKLNHHDNLQEYTDNVNIKTPTKDEVELHLDPVTQNITNTPNTDEKSILTKPNDILECNKNKTGEVFEYSVQESESWKSDNNNTLSDSYNISSPLYKSTYRSTDNSTYIDGILKNRRFNDSPLSRINDSFSRITEYSPSDNIKLEGLKYEISQSSDVCAVSSSMSFSFDPSVDDPPSSKPPTFNSSDTLCQLTSLDQVSTPISPKVASYPISKDNTGISQKELSIELEKYHPASDETYTQGSFTEPESISFGSQRTPTTSTPTHERSISLRSPDKVFNPFPVKSSFKQPKELGLRLGLYKDPLKSPSK